VNGSAAPRFGGDFQGFGGADVTGTGGDGEDGDGGHGGGMI
jgi:hypothetical protein